MEDGRSRMAAARRIAILYLQSSILDRFCTHRYSRHVIDAEKLLEDLTDAQRQALTHVDGPLLIIAGTGTGKTRVITPRRAYPSSQGIRARSTVASTCTNKALDFDHLLLRTSLAMRQHPYILKELQERFGYILIDEYQHTNHAQYVLAHALAMKHRNMCVVGDPDQSIYAWRGADIRNILEFEKDYPDAKVVRLEQNYRSTKTILQVASQLISHNTQRKEKDLWTENDQGQRARVFFCQDEHDEAAVITQQLRELHEKQNYSWNQMAIFY